MANFKDIAKSIVAYPIRLSGAIARDMLINPILGVSQFSYSWFFKPVFVSPISYVARKTYSGSKRLGAAIKNLFIKSALPVEPIPQPSATETNLRQQLETLQADLNAANAAKEAAESRSVGLETQIQNLTSANTTLTEQLTGLQAELNAANVAKNTAEARSAGLETQIQNLTSANSTLTEQFTELQAELNAANAAKEAAEARSADQETQIHNLTNANTTLTDQFTALQADLNSANARSAGLETQIQNLTSANTTLTEQFTELQAELDAANVAKNAAEARSAGLETQIHNLTSANSTLTEQFTELQAKLNAANAAEDAAEAQLQRVRTQKTVVDTLNSKLQSQVLTLNTKLDAARLANQKLESQILELEEQLVKAKAVQLEEELEPASNGSKMWYVSPEDLEKLKQPEDQDVLQQSQIDSMDKAILSSSSMSQSSLSGSFCQISAQSADFSAAQNTGGATGSARIKMKHPDRGMVYAQAKMAGMGGWLSAGVTHRELILEAIGTFFVNALLPKSNGFERSPELLVQLHPVTAQPYIASVYLNADQGAFKVGKNIVIEQGTVDDLAQLVGRSGHSKHVKICADKNSEANAGYNLKFDEQLTFETGGHKVSDVKFSKEQVLELLTTNIRAMNHDVHMGNEMFTVVKNGDKYELQLAIIDIGHAFGNMINSSLMYSNPVFDFLNRGCVRGLGISHGIGWVMDKIHRDYDISYFDLIDGFQKQAPMSAEQLNQIKEKLLDAQGKYAGEMHPAFKLALCTATYKLKNMCPEVQGFKNIGDANIIDDFMHNLKIYDSHIVLSMKKMAHMLTIQKIIWGMPNYERLVANIEQFNNEADANVRLDLNRKIWWGATTSSTSDVAVFKNVIEYIAHVKQKAACLGSQDIPGRLQQQIQSSQSSNYIQL